jgi:hypothetical protein
MTYKFDVNDCVYLEDDYYLQSHGLAAGEIRQIHGLNFENGEIELDILPDRWFSPDRFVQIEEDTWFRF